MADKKLSNIQIVIAAVVIIAIIAIIGIFVLDNNGSSDASVTPTPAPSGATPVATISPNAYTIRYSVGTDAAIARANDVPYYGTELGYFTNVKPVYTSAGAGAAVTAALVGGSLDFAMVNYLTLTRAISKGADLVAVAVYHGSGGSNFDWYVLKDSGINGPADLKGKKVAFVTGSSSELFMKLYLAKAGLTLNDIVQVNVPTGSEIVALKTKQVDAVFIVGSDWDKARMLETGVAKHLFSQTEVTPPKLFHCGLVTTKKFLAEHPNEAKEFIDGYVRAADWERDNPEEAIELTVKLNKALGYPELEPYIRNLTDSDIADHSMVADSDIQWFIDQLVATGELKPGQVTPAQEYTNEYNPYYNK